MRDMKKWVSFELSENKLREVVEVAKKEGFEIEEKKAFEIVKCLYEMFREMYYEEYYEEGEWEVNWKFKKKKNKCKAFLGKEKLVGELFNIFIRVMLDEEKVKFKEAMEESLRIMAEGRDDKIDFFDVGFLMSSRFSFLMRVLGRFIGKYKELLQNGKPEKELSNSSDLLNSVGLLLTVWEDLRSEWFKVFEKNFVVEVG